MREDVLKRGYEAWTPRGLGSSPDEWETGLNPGHRNGVEVGSRTDLNRPWRVTETGEEIRILPRPGLESWVCMLDPISGLVGGLPGFEGPARSPKPEIDSVSL